MSDSLRPHGLQPARLCPWDSLSKNTGVGCCALFLEIFPTQGLNLCILCLPALACGFFTTSTTWEAGQVSTGLQRVGHDLATEQKLPLITFFCPQNSFRIISRVSALIDEMEKKEGRCFHSTVYKIAVLESAEKQ